MEKENKWCVYCGCHINNKVVCSAGRHSYTVTIREENSKSFPYEILTDYEGNIIHDGKTPYFSTITQDNK